MAKQDKKTQEQSALGLQKYASRTLATVWLSLVATFAFAVFNTYLYVSKRALWNLCIAIYYVLLFVIRLTVIVCESKWKNEQNATQKRKNMGIVVSSLFLIADVALIAPIALMAMQKREVSYTTITAISTAAYTVYKIVAASINLKKSKETDNLSVQILRALNFKDAILSIVVLQYVLIKTFGGGHSLDTMCDILNFIFWAMMVSVSVIQVIRVVKRDKSC